MEFNESFMRFSFPEDDCFKIEEDDLVRGRQGVKACECVVYLSGDVAFIEAKSSTPRPNNLQKLEEFLAAIVEKFQSSLEIYTGIKNGVYGEETMSRLPKNLRNESQSFDHYRIYLIVYGHKLEWLPGLSDTVKDRLREVIASYAIKDSQIKVLNEELALDARLIVCYYPLDMAEQLKDKPLKERIAIADEWLNNH